MTDVYPFVKKWLLDGWITEGPQIATPPGLVKMFGRCHQCHRVWPHWWSNVTHEEFKSGVRKYLGCKCGSQKVYPCRIPAWQSVWWFVVVGWLWRHQIKKQRLWDPRIPVMLQDKT